MALGLGLYLIYIDSNLDRAHAPHPKRCELGFGVFYL